MRKGHAELPAFAIHAADALGGESYFGEEAVGLAGAVEGSGPGAEVALVAVEQAVAYGGSGLSLDAEMVGLEAVAGEGERTVARIEGRGIEGIAHGLTPVLVAGVEVVVVVVVHTADLVGYLRGLVVVDGAALVGGVEILVGEGREPAAVVELEVDAPEAVVPSVLEEHLGVVFEEVVVVKAEAPALALVVEAEEPAAQGVARCVGVAIAIGGVAAEAEGSVYVVLETRGEMDELFVLSVV